MTEGHESDFLVTVRAQVMTRDESTEGWLPLAGGGLANVSIRKRARLSPGAAGHEYIIYGQRISDQSVILSCVINRDLKYYKVMPTFHHWRAGKQRNGLTFQTAADARAFDKGVLRAYNELIDGLAKSNPSIICPPLTKYDSVGEDDVFMTLDLPVETESIQKVNSSPEGSEKSHKSVNGSSGIDYGERQNGINSVTTDCALHCADSKKSQIHYISNEQPTCIQLIQTTTVTTSASTPPQQQPPPPLSSATTTTTTATLLPSTAIAAITTTSKPLTSTTTTTTTDGVIVQSPAPPPPHSLEPLTTIAQSENYSYVTLTAMHDYNYPVVDQPVAAQMLSARRDSITTLKKRNAAAMALEVANVTQQQGGVGGCCIANTPASVILKDNANVDLIKKQYQQQLQLQQQHQQHHPHHTAQQSMQRTRCRYCHELYNDEWNRKGACEFAPDCFRSAFECISGLGCARCMLYHCMSDAEGETPQHPCECVNESGCTKRWIGLTLLSLIVPCLWCYPPLRACHWLGVSCGICGGRHKPQV